ncbi:hypothetical protein GCM10017779_10950 [Streptomyces capillispiralis]|nr:hypothetical protein GCM10017779_10950 [Streptomyces capillispiralis]
MIQLDAPPTVAFFLQRLGRSGRRPGTMRNCLFLALGHEGLLSAAALLLQWSRGWVEPVVAPPEPRHLVAQQLLALCLQENRVGENLWREWWGDIGPFGGGAEPVGRHLVEQGNLDRDGGLLFIGPEAARRYGYRHFMNLTAVFTAPPEFTVLNGRTEIGRTDPDLLTEQIDNPRKLFLEGRSWLVTYIDWNRERCFVEPADGGGRARWSGFGAERVRSFALARAARDVLLVRTRPCTKPSGPRSNPPRRATKTFTVFNREGRWSPVPPTETSAGGPGRGTGPTPRRRPHCQRSSSPMSTDMPYAA